MTRTILIVGGGIESVAGIEAAKRLGLKAVVMDGNPAAPAAGVADGFIRASVYDEEEAAGQAAVFAVDEPIHGVIAIACDAALAVARIAEELGIPGPSMETATLATNKLLMKERLVAAGVPVPWFSRVGDLDHLTEIVRQDDRAFVLKPVDSRGARGVLRISGSVDLAWAYDHSMSFSRSRTLIVERWIDGPQVSTESVIWDGRSALAGTGGRNYSRLEELAPFVIEDGGECPCDLSPDMDAIFDDITARAADAIGLRRGTIKGDLVVGEDGVQVIEVATRLSGGYFCTHTIPLVYGVDLIGAAIQVSMDDEPDLEALHKQNIQYAANRFLFLPEGEVEAVGDTESVTGHPWVKLLEVYVKPGDIIGPPTDHTKRGGTVLVVGETREITRQRVEQAIAAIRIDVAEGTGRA